MLPDLTILQGCSFTVNLHVLPISGANIALGIQWLKQLGPVVTNYDTLTMQFHHVGRSVTLRADAPTTPTDASSLQLRRLIQTHSASAFFHIYLSPSPSRNTTHFPLSTNSS